ncbi:hypothetical protein F5884DRAFT_820070 [Xylogone sp. PMI_703]|nr:hypothetical protein F5884DRAFT_820070 [Xylogone sp. PMI_703]
MLGLWSGIKAREHTTPPGVRALYNSSQAAVCAIWLFANIYFVNTIRAKVAALQFPVMLYSIFTNVAFTYGPIFTSTDTAKGFVKQLLEAFLTAFGLATAVNLFIIPITSRTVVFKEMTGYMAGIRQMMKNEAVYLQSLEKSDMFAPLEQRKTKDTKKPGSSLSPEAQALKGSVASVIALHGKLHGDIPFAKREIAWGKLGPHDIDSIYGHFRAILIPLVAMSTIVDIFERIAERRGWRDVPQSGVIEPWEREEVSRKEEEKKMWNEIMKTLHEPFTVAFDALDQAMEHVGFTLELIPRPKEKKNTSEEDVEAKANESRPGEPGFAKFLDGKLKDFYAARGSILRAWARSKGLTSGSWDAASGIPSPGSDYTPNEAQHRRDQQQLYLLLYLEHLLYCAGVSIQQFVEFADKKVEDGTMRKKRLIRPGQRRLRKWLMSIGREDVSIDHDSPDSMEAGTQNIYMGAGFNPKKDPEHLPPTTAWQHFGNGIRTIPRFFGSPESAFGFRCACATLSIGILAYLESTIDFFIKQRLVWAMIIVAIGMSMTSGQSFFGLFGRLAGTTLAMVFSITIWYIPDRHTAGVIVILWLFIFLEMYFFIKFPRFVAVWIVTIVTQVLIVGYELQVNKIGTQAATASGQPYYAIYLLAPYRLATVAAGAFVTFVWTVFPYPISDRSWLRKDLGSTLYLLANYYNVVHSTLAARMHNSEGDMEDKASPGRQLEKVRHKIFGKLLMLLPSLRQHADWQKWEPSIGGKFPIETYDAIVMRATNIMNYLSLISYASQTWADHSKHLFPNNDIASRRAWINDFSAVVDSINPTSHQITSTLSLLSASVRQGSPLPPYMQIPKPYQLSQRLEELDKGILDAKHMMEPGYSTYAVLQVASSMLSDDLTKMADSVRELVGETDFSFRVSTSESSLDSSSGSGAQKGKTD